jgi:hypothetical protein
MLALICPRRSLRSYVAYYWLRPLGRGELRRASETKPAQEIVGTLPDGGKFRLSDYRGRWLFLTVDAGSCEDACQRKLYAIRAGAHDPGGEQERVVRVWLQATDAPAPRAILAEHPGLIVARVDLSPVGGIAGDAGPPRNIYLIDPLGNIVLRYPADPDIKRMAKDLDRLLRASRIG